MQEIFNFLKSETFIIILFFSILILFILYISNYIKLKKLRKSYKLFMNKLGNGNNIDEMLKEYIKDVENVKKEGIKTLEYCKNIDKNVSKCTQKIGMVRYNAYKDTGSDLSFTLALLNKYNDGVVLNGIYSREMSNIYAKSIENGKSKYALSEEEKSAIEKAIENT